MWILLGTVFIASLPGSLHCVGMCGPFAILASANADKRKSALLPAVAYSLGRLVTYSVVGAFFGALGLAINRGTSVFAGIEFEAVQQTATLIAGGFMVLVGIIALARQLGWQIALPQVGGGIQSVLRKSFQRVRQQPRIRRAFLIGALTCLMPCGWLYTFAIIAAGTGSPLWGTMVMVAFWAGTVPILVALMLGFGKLGQKVRQKIPLAMAVTVILVGCFTIAFRAPVAIGNDIPVIHETNSLIQQVQSADHSELSCCSGS